MNKIITILILLTIVISPSQVFAQKTLETETPTVEQVQEDTLVDTSSLFNVELSTDTQSAWDKSVPLVIKFRSNIDADKVEISWDSPSGTKITRKHPQFISVKKGEVYTYRASLKPEIAGLYNVAGNVTVWQYNTNYTTSASINIRFGEDLLTIPQSAGYTGAVIMKYLVYLLLLAIGVGLGYFGFKYLLKYLKVWLKPPE